MSLIGDNSGGLDLAQQIKDNLFEKHSELRARADQLAGMENGVDGPVTTEDAANKVSEAVRQCTAFEKEANTTRVAEKAPYLEGERAVDGFFQNLAGPVTKTKTALLRLRSDYDIAVERAERARILAAAIAEREAAERAAQEAAEAQRNKAAAVERAAVAESRAEEAAQATKATSADLTRTRSDSGVTTSLKTEWRHEIVDRKKVPRKLCEPSDALIRLAIKGATNKDGSNNLVDADGNSLVAGLRIYRHQFSQVR